MDKKRSFRKIINIMHLWVGLPSALILFVVCLSGTTYVFNKEITRWVDRDKFYVQHPGSKERLPLEQLTRKVLEANKGMRVAAVTVPASPHEAWLFSLGEKAKKSDSAKVGMMPDTNGPNSEKNGAAERRPKSGKKREKLKNYLVDPYTANIQGDAQTTTSEFFNTVLQLHRWLLMDHEIGSVITGIAALLFLFLEITGLLLWLPAKWRSWKHSKAWKTGLTIKTANRKRFNHDLHRSLGFYTFFVVTLLALTGPVLGLDWYKKGFQSLMGVRTQEGGMQSKMSAKPVQDSKPLSADRWMAAADSIYPYKGDLRINFPKDGGSGVSIAKIHKEGFYSSGADRLTLDQYTNAVISREPFSDKRLGEQIASLVKDIHTGEVFGGFSKTLYFLACLLATSLPVTGVFIWLNKRKKPLRTSSMARPLRVVPAEK